MPESGEYVGVDSDRHAEDSTVHDVSTIDGRWEPAGSRQRQIDMTRSPRRTTMVATAGVLLVAGCAGQPNEGAAPVADRPTPTLVADAYDGRFRAFATVLESPEHGPQLCNAVAESYPPQCGGPDIAGWDWSLVEHEEASETRWGGFVLVGTFDGKTFTLTEPATVDDGSERPQNDPDQFETPCPEPAGGWQPVDPELATEAAFQEAAQVAQAGDGFGGLWIDQQTAESELTEANANDPRSFVLNVTTTADAVALHNAIREVWGGSLCVSRAVRDEATLLEVQSEVTGDPGVMGSAPDIRTGQLVVQVYVATAEQQRTYDERYGAGTVRLEGALTPID